MSTAKFLPYYSSQLNSVEVNYTFGKLPSPEMVQRWLAQTPEGFRFSFKAPRRITHFKRLIDCGTLVGEFFDTLKPAAGKMGLVLFQLPPNFKADLPRLGNFLAAAAFQREDAPHVAFEFRHESWFTDGVEEILRKRNAACCVADTDDLQTPEMHTAAEHTCFRLRRAGGYKPRELAAFAKRFRTLAAERDVYVYFRHEDEPTGALNALALRKAAAK